jgi:hypothetical protein
MVLRRIRSVTIASVNEMIGGVGVTPIEAVLVVGASAAPNRGPTSQTPPPRDV